MLLYLTISLHQESGLVRGVVSLEGDSLLSLHFTISLHQRSGLVRGVASLEGGGGEFIVIAFYYFIASEIYPDKRGGFP